MFSPTRIIFKAPDCLLGVVTQPTDSRLSDTSRCRDRAVSHAAVGVAAVTDTITEADVNNNDGPVEVVKVEPEKL